AATAFFAARRRRGLRGRERAQLRGIEDAVLVRVSTIEHALKPLGDLRAIEAAIAVLVVAEQRREQLVCRRPRNWRRLGLFTTASPRSPTTAPVERQAGLVARERAVAVLVERAE